MGQVNLISKEHDHQPLNALTKMSFTIMKTMLHNKLINNDLQNKLIIKNNNNGNYENMKIRSEEHLHCNSEGSTMNNEYFKFTEINDMDLIPIAKIKESEEQIQNSEIL